MDHRTATKHRPTPLKDLQTAVQADQSRRYLILDSHPSASFPTYPFGPLQWNHLAWQVEASAIDASNYRWYDSLDNGRRDPALPTRSFTPPISPPALSPRGQDAEYSSKRSGRTFALVPAQVNGRRVFTHVVVNPQDNASIQGSRSPSISPQEDGLPGDMQDMLRELDSLASWVKAASSSRDYTGNLSDGLFLNKGKSRLLPTSLPSECDVRVDSSRCPVIGISTKISPATDEGFIYIPDRNTPEFLVGSSSSPIAYPVCGYSSHPSRYSPHPLDTTHAIPYHRRYPERRSAPCPPPTSPLVSPPSGKTSFKMLFQRSRCNTTSVARPSIPSSHVPVESALRQGKRMRLPWLRI